MTDTNLGQQRNESAFSVGTASVAGGIEASPALGSMPEPAASSASAAGAAESVASKVKNRLAGAAAAQKGGVADRLEELAESLGKSSEQFAGKQDWIASAIARGGTELGALASSLRESDLRDLARQLQGFAQRRPTMFIGSALIGGFALARFGKIVAADVSRADLPSLPEVGHGGH
ncbi:hypothetical protein ACMGDM_08475 [Sphingomonas sp. DT-51]|uniref:hypothetical protein n=1 Tax=Sphingomonas sp. DT-51 TaxID=3396165 RepID=UPI003F19739C